MAKKVLSITSLRDPVAGQVEIDGVEYDVLKFNRDQYAVINSWDNETPVTESYALVAVIVPTMPDTVLGKLNKPEVRAILAMAGSGIEAVEALFPNAISPATTASTSPG